MDILDSTYFIISDNIIPQDLCSDSSIQLKDYKFLLIVALPWQILDGLSC